MDRVFVSSTVFDLLDVRAEVERHLRELGFSPVLSGSATADFRVLPDKNSIETCLVNLEGCELVVVILCRRYGPTLKKAGFDDLSATHLEYRHARANGKPVYLYVRDRLEADYRQWKESARSGDSGTFSWVVRKGDQRLFEFIDEHQTLRSDATATNWYTSFSDSTQLKQILSRDLRMKAGTIELSKLIRGNQIPIIHADIQMRNEGAVSNVHFRVTLRNVGAVPAFNIEWELRLEGAGRMQFRNDDPAEAREFVLAPQQETGQSFMMPGTAGVHWQRASGRLIVQYQMAQGHSVHDEHEIGVELRGDMCFLLARQTTKRLEVGDPDTVPLEIVSAQ